ncbi:TPA: hypothetical protein QCU33_005340 [Bacillus cereus]|nr:hypothetical protein [Bacillus cereus]
MAQFLLFLLALGLLALPFLEESITPFCGIILAMTVFFHAIDIHASVLIPFIVLSAFLLFYEIKNTITITSKGILLFFKSTHY